MRELIPRPLPPVAAVVPVPGDADRSVSTSPVETVAARAISDLASPPIVGRGDFPGLVFDVPASVRTAADRVALGRQNAAIVAAAIANALPFGRKRLTFPERAVVLANGPGGRPPLYVSGAMGPGAHNFFFGLDGTQVLLAGTDRDSAGGLAQFESLNGPCGFEGSGSVDYCDPQSVCGFISKIIDPTHVVLTLDHPFAPTSIDKVLVRDPADGRFLGRLCYASAYPGMGLAPATGANRIGGVGTDYVLDMSTPGTGQIDCTFLVEGAEIAMGPGNPAFLVTGVLCDKVVLPEGLRVFQAANGVFYGMGASLDAECHCEPALITSAIAARGRFRRPLLGGGGFLFTPSELSSNIGATIIGTDDDVIDIAAYNSPIAAVTGAKSLAVPVNDARLPQPGLRVSLLDPSRIERAVLVVASKALGPDNSATLTFTGSMPPGVSPAWSLSPVTTSRGVFVKPTARLQFGGSCLLRVSEQHVDIGDGVVLGPSIGPAVQLSGGGTTEYADMKRVHIGHLNLVSPLSGRGFERSAAVVVRPPTADGRAVAAAGAFGDVHIESLTVSGTCNGPLLAVSSAERFYLGRALGQGLNAAPTPYTSLGTGFDITIEATTYARLDDYTNLDRRGGTAQVGCIGVGTLELGELADVAVPRRGVATLIAYGKWLDTAPKLTPAGNGFGAGAPNVNARWRRLRGRAFELEGRLDLPNDLGTPPAAGPLTLSLPVTVGPAAWVTGTVTDERNRAGQWDIHTQTGLATCQIYLVGKPGKLVPGAALFFRLAGESAD